MIRTRFAPTPSGQLHLGNIANFLLVEKLAREGKGSIRLRIDDCDGTRTRPEFIRQIFETLHWLGVEWQEGPRSPAEFPEHSQIQNKEKYWQRLQVIRQGGENIYACACSRKEIGDGPYPGSCRGKKLAFTPGTHALRLRIDEPGLAREFGDPVLWRKDGGPAYHLASVTDDLDHKINLIVRGEDLKSTTELQKHIAKIFTGQGFGHVTFVHHPLLTGPDGEKLSKSKDSLSIAALRREGATPESIRAQLEPRISEWRARGDLPRAKFHK